ncbi:hypothetical protein N9954_05925 [Maribacter sp.]|nr:hypothetical protein [Maribacter sp.]
MKYKVFLVFLVALNFCSSQEVKMDQATLLKRYTGEWVSSVAPDSNEVSKNPKIKMVNVQKMGGNSIQVEVFQLQDGNYSTILLELLSYDVTTDQIVALGQNKKGECFTGVGRFYDNDNWTMRDKDFQGNPVQTVSFKFLSDIEVYLEGIDPKGKVLWRTRYVKI